MPRTINIRVGQRGRTGTAVLSGTSLLSHLGSPKTIGAAGYSGAGSLSALTVGYVEPTAANTGIAGAGLTTADLTVINGDLTVDDTYVSNNGTTIDKLWIKGHLLYTATTPVTVTRSQVQGRTFVTAGSPPYEVVVRARRTTSPDTARLSMEYCTLTCVQPDVNLSNAAGERLGHFHYCDISLGSDGLDFWSPSPPKVLGCYFHDYSFWANDSKHSTDSRHPGWSHNDWVQCSGTNGGASYIEGNSFDTRAALGVGDVDTLTTWSGGSYASRNWGSAVALTPSAAHITNVDIHHNWFRYSEGAIFMTQQNGSYDFGNSMSVHDNLFNYSHGWGPYSGNYSIQFVRWGYPEGPQPTDVYSNRLLSDPNVPSALRGTLLPSAVLTGGTGATGQYAVALNNATQV